MTGEHKPNLADEPGEAAESETGRGLSRRRFLVSSAGAAAAVAGSMAAHAAPDHDHMAPPKRPKKSAEELARVAKLEAAFFETFSEPSTEVSRGGTLETTLNVVQRPVIFREPEGLRAELVRTYNGQVPGPTFRILPGETFKVHLVNRLPKNSDEHCTDEHAGNQPHCFNTTNLHTHGLHVSPKEPSDNVFVEVPPLADDPVRGKYDFCFALPTFHKPGTHWYHAHKHGSTAIQLVNGMAGALIVDDPPGKELAQRPAKDLVFIIQEIIGKQDTDVYTCTSQTRPEFRFLINGRYNPTINIAAGETQRWRFINATATPRGLAPLQFLQDSAPVNMQLIAVDGIYLPFPRTESEWLVGPGNRADFLVRFDNPGTYTVTKKEYQPGGGDPFPAQTLVTVDVEGPAMAMELLRATPALPQYLKPITDEEIKQAEQAKRTNTVTFSVSASDGNCAGQFKVDGKGYDPDDPGIEVNLGETWVWTIKNTSGAAHPFHIHVNPFMVIDNNGTAIPFRERYWQDTVVVPKDGYVKLATRFETFDGPFVLHCHILVHEDWGMMRKVVVKGKGAPPCTKVG